MRRAAPLVALLAAALLALWASFSGGGGPSAGSASDPRGTPGSPVSPTLAGRPEGAPPAAPPAPSASAVPPSEGSQPRGSVEVEVVDEGGRPLPGATVTWSRPSTPAPESADAGEGVADRSGSVRFEEVPAGEVVVRASAEGHGREGAFVQVRPAERASQRLALARWWEASGRVLLPSGEPVEGATVVARWGGSLEGRTEYFQGAEFEVGRTASARDGAFRLGVPPGRFVTLLATLPPHAPAERTVRLREAGAGIDLRLGVGGRVQGTVRDPSGRPCPEARVFVVPADVPELLENPRVVVLPGGASCWSSDDEAGLSTESDAEGPIRKAWRATTDAEGRFEVGGLPLPLRLLALAEGCEGARGASQAVALEETAPEARLEVPLTPRATLEVEARGVDGSPAGAQVTLLGASGHFLEPRAEGARLGACDLDVGPAPGGGWAFRGLVGGAYDVYAEIEACVPVRQRVEVPATGRVRVVLQGRPGLPFRVDVVDPDGRPVADAQVHLSLPEGPGVVAQSATLACDAEGRCAFRGLQDGTGLLTVTSETHVNREVPGVRVPDGAVRVVVEPLPEVRGRLVPDGLEHTPSRAWVEEHAGEQERVRPALVTPEGGLRYRVQSVGQEALLILSPSEGAQVVLGRFLLRPGDVRDLGEIRVDRGRAIEGRVLDGAGAPVAGVRILAAVPGVAPTEDGFRRAPPQAVTDPTGAFALHGVHRGPAVLHTRHETFAPTSAEDDGRAGTREIRLVPGAFLEARLVTAGGRPSVTNHLLLEGHGEPRVLTGDEQRRIRVGPLAPGAYRVVAVGTRDADRREVARFTLGAGERRIVEWEIP